jgi:hypothetical protein
MYMKIRPDILISSKQCLEWNRKKFSLHVLLPPWTGGPLIGPTTFALVLLVLQAHKQQSLSPPPGSTKLMRSEPHSFHLYLPRNCKNLKVSTARSNQDTFKSGYRAHTQDTSGTQGQ